jgi:hypothetical protein
LKISQPERPTCGEITQPGWNSPTTTDFSRTHDIRFRPPLPFCMPLARSSPSSIPSHLTRALLARKTSPRSQNPDPRPRQPRHACLGFLGRGTLVQPWPHALAHSAQPSVCHARPTPRANRALIAFNPRVHPSLFDPSALPTQPSRFCRCVPWKRSALPMHLSL